MTTGLDPGARRVAWDLIDQIRDRGTTVVLVTHFMDEAERLCDRLAVFSHGRIIAEGTPTELVDAHAGDATVHFTTDASRSVVAGRRSGRRADRTGRLARERARHRPAAGLHRGRAGGPRHRADSICGPNASRSRTRSWRSPPTARRRRMKALRKLTWVELKLFTRDPLSLVFTLALPFFFLIVLNGVFGNEPEIDPVEDVWRGVGPADYYVPGLPRSGHGGDRRAEHARAAGQLPRAAAFCDASAPRPCRCGRCSAPRSSSRLLTAVVGAVSITIASSLIYGTDFPSDVLLLIPAFVLAALSFAALGVVLGSVLPTSRSAQGAGIMLFFVMFLLSGSGPPRGVLSDAMRQVGQRPSAHPRRHAPPGSVARLRLGHQRVADRWRHPRRLGGAVVPLLPWE